MEISFNINPNGSFSFSIGSAPKANRINKGKSLLISTDSFVSIDIETTGLSPEYDEIIELGAVKYINGQASDTFSSLVRPENSIDDFVTELTGITNDMLYDAPSLQEILPDFISFIGDSIIVGHNVNFDINFIYDACEKINLPSFSNDFIDTMRLSRRMYKDLKNHKLDTLIGFFGLTQRNVHRGLEDCKLTAICYQKMIADEARFDEAIKYVAGHRSRGKKSLKEIVAVEGYENPDNPFYGQVCVFTGTLEHFTRKEVAQLVVNIGGICEDRITKKTNYLILGNNDYCASIKDGKSNKQKKAEKLITEGADLAIIPESVFIDMIQTSYEDDSTEDMLPADDVEKNVANEEMEEKTYSLISHGLQESLVAENLSAEYLFFRKSKTSTSQYSSVYLFNENSVFCRISFRGKQNYFSISSKYESIIPNSVEYKKQKSDPNFCRIMIESPDDILTHMDLLHQVLNAEIDAYPADFGCCSRYEECSDAKKCTHPNPDMALRCIYRKNLKHGKTFYGKNKNV